MYRKKREKKKEEEERREGRGERKIQNGGTV